jgi:NADH:ubiquinone oxidoreductase subunit K
MLILPINPFANNLYILFNLSFFIFLTGLLSTICFQRNLLHCLIAIELMFLGLNTNFIIIAQYLNDPTGQIYALLTLAIIAADSAIGLALLLLHFQLTDNIQIESLTQLKG